MILFVVVFLCVVLVHNSSVFFSCCCCVLWCWFFWLRHGVVFTAVLVDREKGVGWVVDGGFASITSYYFVHDQSRHRFVLPIRSTKYSGRNDGAFPSIVLHRQLNRQ